MDKKYHIVYETTNLINGKIYRGKHSTDKLEDGYIGSGCAFSNAVAKYGKTSFSRKVLKFCDSVEEALAYEKEVVTKEFCSRSDNYNILEGGGNDTTGMLSVIDSSGNQFLTSLIDPRYLSGELKSLSCKRIVVKDIKGNIFCTTTDDIRYIAGDLVPQTKGMLVVKDKTGATSQVSKNDPRYISGELVPIVVGTVQMKTVSGKIVQVDKSDPRIKTGELVGTLKNKITVKDSKGKTYSVDTDNPRYLSGELVHLHKGKSYNRNRKFITDEVSNKMLDLSKYLIPEGWRLGKVGRLRGKGKNETKTKTIKKPQ